MRRTEFRRLAITGGVGCGKSAVADILRSKGIPVLDADDVARRILEPGMPVTLRVLRAFGPAVRDPGGGVNRAALAARVFRDPKARQRLNRLTHPEILRMCRQWMKSLEDPVAAVVIPLLHELNLERRWPEIWCVTTRRETALRRLVRRGWSRAEALRRMRSQLPVQSKAARSTRVIENNGTLRDLRRAVESALGPREGRRHDGIQADPAPQEGPKRQSGRAERIRRVARRTGSGGAVGAAAPDFRAAAG